MKWFSRILWFAAVGAGLFPALTRAQTDSTLAAIAGYVDAGRAGTNNRFRDANGDGVNDVTGKPYPHRFGYADQNGDGINDRFTDADGDGVNDLDGRVVDLDGDGVCDNVLDQDADGRNDVTGEAYDDQLKGWRYGLVNEETGQTASVFVDEDGDGANDSWESGSGRGHRGMAEDLFIDEDGDGIADGRTVRGREGLGQQNRSNAGSRGSMKADQAKGREKEGQGKGREKDTPGQGEKGKGSQHRHGAGRLERR